MHDKSLTNLTLFALIPMHYHGINGGCNNANITQGLTRAYK